MAGGAEKEEQQQQQRRARVVFVLGGPGSGKGTQCARLVSAAGAGVSTVCAGELLRAAAQRDAEIRATIDRGAIVPGHVTIGLLRDALRSASRAHAAPPVVLLDGFPRALEQAEAFEAALGAAELVLFFDCPAEELRARLAGRARTSGRADDDAAVIESRLRTFRETSMPVVERYAALGALRTIDATGAPAEVFARFTHALADAQIVPRAELLSKS